MRRPHSITQVGSQPLDLRFINAVEDAIAQICEAPARWRIFDGEQVRRHLTRVFPYGVLYSIEPNYVLIVAVAHCSREPGYWRRRLP
jgi:toxin ParE1/3/4